MRSVLAGDPAVEPGERCRRSTPQGSGASVACVGSSGSGSSRRASGRADHPADRRARRGGGADCVPHRVVPSDHEDHRVGRSHREVMSDWRERAACRGRDPAWWFSGSPFEQAVALRVCASCPVRTECLRAALAEEEGLRAVDRFGVRRGLAPRQRARLAVSRRVTHRQGPDVGCRNHMTASSGVCAGWGRSIQAGTSALSLTRRQHRPRSADRAASPSASGRLGLLSGASPLQRQARASHSPGAPKSASVQVLRERRPVLIRCAAVDAGIWLGIVGVAPGGHLWGVGGSRLAQAASGFRSVASARARQPGRQRR
jgi:hypothetical protein